MRSLLRWLRRLVLTALALGALVVAAALISAHTAWGREQLRRRVEAALQGAFPGGARVTDLAGSVLGTLTLRGVELDAVDHRPLITAGSVDVSLALWPLAFHTARFDRALADDVHVFVRDASAAGGAGPAAATVAAPPGQPSPWRVELPAVAVHRAVVDIARASLALGDLDLAGAAAVADGRIAVSGIVRGRWSRAGQPAAPLAACGDLIFDGSVRISHAVATVGGATLVASGLGVDPDHPAGWLAVAAPPAAVTALLPELTGIASPAAPGSSVNLAVSLELIPDGESTRVAVLAAVGEARLWAALRGSPARRTARGIVLASAVDLAAITRGQLVGRGFVAGAIDLGPDRGRGLVFAQAELAAPDLPLHRASGVLLGNLDDLRMLAAGSGDDDLQITALAGGRLDAGGFVIDRGRAVASARGLALPGRRITGALALDAQLADRFLLVAPSRVPPGTHPAARLDLGARIHIIGVATARGLRVEPTDAGAGARLAIGALRSPFAVSLTGGDRGAPIALAVRDATATAVAYDDLRVAAARASLGAAVGPELQIDSAQVVGTAIRRASTLLGDARLDLARRGTDYRIDAMVHPPRPGLAIATEAWLRRTDTGYRAVLGATRVDTPDGGAWSSLGGALVVPAAAGTPIQLRGLTLRRGDAAIALSADYLRATGALAAHIDADRVDIATLGLGAPPPDARHLAAGRSADAAGLRGHARATVDVSRRGGHWQADAAVALAGFATRPAAQPIDATAHVALGRHVTLDATVTSATLGELGVSFDAAAPSDPFDLTAWQQLDRDTIRTAAITARNVAVPVLVGAAGAGLAGTGGTIDGAVDLAPGALRGELTVRGVALPLGALDASVRIAPVDGDLDVHGAATLAGIASGNAEVRLGLPQHPFDAATWRRRGRDLVRGGSVHLDEVVFDPALLARLGVTRGGEPLPYRGRARAELRLGAAAGEPHLAVDLIDVTGGPLVAPLSQHIELDADASGTRLHTELRARPLQGEASAAGVAGAAGAAGAPGAGGAASQLASSAGSELALGTLDANVRMTLDRWLDEPLAVLGAPVSASWHLPRAPVAPLLALLGRRELIGGTIEANAEIRGTVAEPMVPSLDIAVRNARVAARLGGRSPPELRELDITGNWDGANAALTVTGREATGGELRVTASGRAPGFAELTGTARLTRLDVAPIAALLPGALGSAAGVVDGDLTLGRGNQVTGKLRVTGGALPLAAAIGTLRDATAELTSDGRKVTATVDGRLGRGTIHLTARAPADDLAAVTADVQLRQVSPITALRPILTADITAELHRVGDQLRGDVRLANGSVTLPEHSGPALLAVDVPADLVLAGAAPAGARGPHAPAHPWLVVDVHPGAVRVDARKLAKGIGFLGTLRGDRLEIALGDSVGVRGTLEVESADVDLFGRRYIVAPSAVVFDGTTDPRLDIHMSHSFPDLTLQVDVLGRASRRELQFSSDVSIYSTDVLFAFFLGGEPASDVNNPNRDQARVAVLGATTRLVSGEIGQQLNKVLPVHVDAASCEPDPSAAAATAGSCTVGKWLSEQVFLAYRQHIQPRLDENTGDAQLQIRLGNRVLVEGTVGDRGHHGVDLLWRQRW